MLVCKTDDLGSDIYRTGEWKEKEIKGDPTTNSIVFVWDLVLTTVEINGVYFPSSLGEGGAVKLQSEGHMC